MKTEISFLDKARNKFKLSIEITTRNGYPEFTASGEYGGSAGQCLDSIKPANKFQKEIVAIWKKHHLKNVSKVKGFEETLNTVIEGIKKAEAKRKAKVIEESETPFSEKNDDEFLEYVEKHTTFTDRDAELCVAFIKMFSLSEDDVQDIEIDGNRSKVQGIDYLAGTDSEMDDEWDENLENYIDECLLPKVKDENIQKYFDREAWKRDAKFDGRGHSLNYWDGGEEEATVNGTAYYAYQN